MNEPRTRTLKVINQLEKLRDSDEKVIRLVGMNFVNLKNKVEQFYTLLIMRNFHIEDRIRQEKRVIESIESLLKARRMLEDCISIFKSNFELETNSYIQHTNHKSQSYVRAKENLGVASSRLDAMTEKITSLERRSETGKLFNTASLVWIEDFKQNLLHFMESFVIMSLENAINKFNDTDTAKIKFEDKEKEVRVIKDANLFFWFLFVEFYRVCEVEGSVSRQNVNMGKTDSLQKTESTNISSRPSFLPENVKYEEKEEEIRITNPFEEEI